MGQCLRHAHCGQRVSEESESECAEVSPGTLNLKTAFKPRMETDEHGLGAGCLANCRHFVAPLCRSLCRSGNHPIDKVGDKVRRQSGCPGIGSTLFKIPV